MSELSERYPAEPNGAVPAYAERAEQLLREAHRLFTSFENAPGRFIQHGEDVMQWVERYALHVVQADHPDSGVDVNHWSRHVGLNDVPPQLCVPQSCPPFVETRLETTKMWFGEEEGWLTYEEAVARGLRDPEVDSGGEV